MTGKRLTFLIVDDDAGVVEMVKSSLASAFKGALIFTAMSGMEALQKIRNADPTMILLDVCMPKLDAAAVLEVIFAHNKTQRYIVICMTGLDADAPELAAIRAKKVPILHKPFKLGELMDIAKREIARMKEPK